MISRTSFAVNVSVDLSLEESLFDHDGLLVVGNILERVALAAQRCVFFGIVVQQHGVLQFLLITSQSKGRQTRNMRARDATQKESLRRSR